MRKFKKKIIINFGINVNVKKKIQEMEKKLKKIREIQRKI